MSASSLSGRVGHQGEQNLTAIFRVGHELLQPRDDAKAGAAAPLAAISLVAETAVAFSELGGTLGNIRRSRQKVADELDALRLVEPLRGIAGDYACQLDYAQSGGLIGQALHLVEGM